MFWFKQLGFYRFHPAQWPDDGVLSAQLSAAAFAGTQGLEWSAEGFVPPYAFTQEWLFAAEHTRMSALKREEKVLPTGVIRDLLDERVAQIQEAESRQLGKKEKKELKERLTDELLPKAFTRSARTYALIDRKNGFLLLNQAAESRREAFLAKLRQTLGGLEAVRPETVRPVADVMTAWLAGGTCDGGFELDDNCELKGTGDGAAVVRMSRQNLDSEEVVRHLDGGKSVSQLGLVWRDRVAFTLTADFALKRIRYLDTLTEESERYGSGEADLAFATQFLMAESLAGLLQELAACCGGWREKA